MNSEQYQSNMLLGLDKEFLLKTQLLQVLDNANVFLTTTEISRKIPYFSIDTIQQACRSLKEDFSHLYTNHECELIISKRYGIRLIRHQVTLKSLIDYYA